MLSRNMFFLPLGNLVLIACGVLVYVRKKWGVYSVGFYLNTLLHHILRQLKQIFICPIIYYSIDSHQ
jgi:hypothetical protein